MNMTPLHACAIVCAALAIAIGTSSCTEYQYGAFTSPSATAPATQPPAGYENTGAPQANPPAQPKPQRTSNYPLATPIEGKPGQVISPFKPHNVIDVRGYRSGQLARDPSTAPVDKTTGKADINQAKIFEIP